MRKSTTLFTVVMACALPLAASANDMSSSNQPSSTHIHSSSVRDTSVRSNARGGGPETANAPATGQETRAQQLHAISPHIITVQSKIDAAQAEARGIERIASLERAPLSNVYSEHLRGFERDLQSDVNDARHHLDELRSAVQNVQVSASVNNDIQQADQALQQVRTTIEQFQGGRGQQQGAQAQQAGAMDARTFGTTVSRDLNNAKTAINRVERGLR